MALKVAGTEVVDNSRGLKNIATVDATTAAAITAAGVGGGGTFDFTASGAISSGDVVVLNTNGTVSSVSTTPGATTEVYNYTKASANFSRVKATVGKRSNGVTDIAHEIGNDGSTIRLYGTLNVTGNITMSGFYPSCVNVPNSDDVVVAFSTSSSGIETRYYSSNNTAYTYVDGQAPGYIGASYPNSHLLYDSTNNQYILIVYGSTLTKYATGTWNGSNMAWSSYSSNFLTPGVTNNSYYENSWAYLDQATNTIVVCNGPTVAIGTVSSGSITFGTPVTFNSNTARQGAQVSIDGAGKGIIIYSYSISTNYYVNAHPFTYSGTSITAGTATLLSSGTSAIEKTGGVYSSRLGGWVASYYDNSGADSTFVFLTTDGSTVSTSRSVTVSNFNSPKGGPVYELPTYNSFVYRQENAVIEIEYASDTTDADNWIGISAQTISDSATGTITIPGGVNEQQTGLTVGSTYYVANDGSLATVGTRKIGKAIASTKLLITEGNA